MIGVARFSEPGLRERSKRHGIECIACDLLDRAALQRLPNVADGVRNCVFMAGHKFGAAGNASLTWMMNVGVPMMVAETFREIAHRRLLDRLRVPVRAGRRPGRR